MLGFYLYNVGLPLSNVGFPLSYVRQVDGGGARHLGRRLCQRRARCLRQDLPFYTVDKPELEI